MVQTANLGERNDLAASRRFNGPGIRRVLAESKVRPGNVIVAEIAERVNDFETVPGCI